MGHSTGGLLAQMLAGRGALGSHGCDRPGAVPRRAAAARLRAQGRRARCSATPLNRGRAITLTFDQFNTAGRTRSTRTRRSSSTRPTTSPRRGSPLVQMANANLNPWTEAKVDTKNPDRGPLLIIDGEKDHTVPWAIANAAYKRQKRNPGVTEIMKMPNRGHSLTIDHGWQEVAQTALDFVQEHAPATT